MILKNALRLHNGDEVIVKRTKECLRVVETAITPKEYTANNMTCVDVLLTDGNWYGYKEIR